MKYYIGRSGSLSYVIAIKEVAVWYLNKHIEPHRSMHLPHRFLEDKPTELPLKYILLQGYNIGEIKTKDS